LKKGRFFYLNELITFATMISRNQIKFVQSLRLKKFRDQHGLFIAEGEKIVAELINSKLSVKMLFAVEEWVNLQHQNISESIDLHVVSGKELERISNMKTPNKVLAVIQQPQNLFTGEIFSEGLVLMLDKIQDPGNLGTILRTADWFGVRHVICSPDTADVYNPKTIQSSMGSFIRVQTYYTDLGSCIDKLNKDVIVYGAFPDASDLYSVKPALPAVLVVGNESKGISAEVASRIQQKLMIPSGVKNFRGGAESLNAAMATGIILSWVTKNT